jgi:hypothetical protein
VTFLPGTFSILLILIIDAKKDKIIKIGGKNEKQDGFVNFFVTLSFPGKFDFTNYQQN